MKFIQIVSIILVSLVVIVNMAGCAPKPKNIYEPAKSTQQMSQLETRQLQTKTFSANNEEIVHKAVVSALQDEGFIILQYNKTIGLVTANIESNQVDEATKRWRTGNLQNGWQTIRKLKASCTVSLNKKDEYKVRINLVEQGIADTGGVLWSQTVSDPNIYQNLFSKIDKSIFLQKENL